MSNLTPDEQWFIERMRGIRNRHIPLTTQAQDRLLAIIDRLTAPALQPDAALTEALAQARALTPTVPPAPPAAPQGEATERPLYTIYRMHGDGREFVAGGWPTLELATTNAQAWQRDYPAEYEIYLGDVFVGKVARPAALDGGR